MTKNNNDTGIIAKYLKYLPIKKEFIVSLNEGSTPLIYSPKLSHLVNQKSSGSQVYIKYEGLNPTASFKDRGMTFAVSKAFEKKVKMVICASTGNTSASSAAYAARANLKCIVILPAGKIAKGKLAQAIIYGAKIVSIDGNFDDALEIVRELGKRDDIEIVNSINKYRIQGQKTASFEIIDALGDAPSHHILPVGNAGNITAYWLGYNEFFNLQKSTRKPKMLGFQAKNSAPIYYNKIVKNPETIATAIRIGNPASWQEANKAITDSNGKIDIVSDEEILVAQRWLAANEGIFVEPASASSIAGLMNFCKDNSFPDASSIVCTVTGHGLKDTETAISFDYKIIDAKNDVGDVLQKIS